MPKNAKEALEINVATGTNHWRKAIKKELDRVGVAWEVRDDLSIDDVRSGKALIGYTEILCHLVFDVKMDFTRKARLVAGGHMTEAPNSITYSSVVSRDSIRLVFLIAALNDLDIMACDIGNAYLHAPCREKVWFAGTLDSGEDSLGKVCVVTRALYGLKSSGASWRSMLASSLRDLGYEDTRADPDVWRRKRTRPSGEHYYELICVYVDDILCVDLDPKASLLKLGEIYNIKEGSLKPPDTYLGAQVKKKSLPDGTYAWGMSSTKYCEAAIDTVQQMLKEDGDGFHLKTTQLTPFDTSYKPELNVTKELGPELASRYRQLLGILRWTVEIGRIDIYTKVSLISQYLCSPREGHLEAVYQIFAYLKKHPKSTVLFDLKQIPTDESAFPSVTLENWREFYGDLAEELPPHMPEPLG